MVISSFFQDIFVKLDGSHILGRHSGWQEEEEGNKNENEDEDCDTETHVNHQLGFILNQIARVDPFVCGDRAPIPQSVSPGIIPSVWGLEIGDWGLGIGGWGLGVGDWGSKPLNGPG